MSIKLALLKSGETVISDAKELISDDKVCGYIFSKPQVVQTRQPVLLLEDESEGRDQSNDLEISMSPWIFLSKDQEIPVTPDWIVTIIDPIDELVQMYEEKING
jgi:hypothetical protein